MGGWHHRLNGHGFGWTPGIGGQGGRFMGSQRVGHETATELNGKSSAELLVPQPGLW